MRNIIALAIIMIIMVSCEKPNRTPEGPTDVRIKNLTDQIFTNVIVDTGGGEHNYGDIAAKGITDYLRFDKAYPDAEITATINGEVYTTGEQDYTYATYIGPDKITYEVYIINSEQRILEVDVIIDAPIDQE
ncbi:MAG: hypothetical protein U5K32_05320 [Bacteroidales bacterium]|nr:hypothetical protein [Bacteroidales bacterium]